MLYLTKEYKFCAAHQYWNKDWSSDKNEDIFGDDVRIHGHNYKLAITVKGQIDNHSGFIVDLKKLNEVISKYVIDIFDHSQIEKDIEWFHDKQPSTENMVIFIWKQIQDKIPSNAILHCVKLRETPTIFTEYYGPQNKDFI